MDGKLLDVELCALPIYDADRLIAQGRFVDMPGLASEGINFRQRVEGVGRKQAVQEHDEVTFHRTQD